MKKLLLLCLMFSPAALASELQTELKHRLAQFTSYQADFNQTVSDAQGNVIQQSIGKLYVAQPNRLRWEVVAPDETTLIADGSSIWLIDPFAEQVTAMTQGDAIKNNPIVLLTDPDSSAWNDFTYSGELGNYVVTSKDPQSQIVALTFTFDNEILSGLVIEDRQQQRSELQFSNPVVNAKLEDAMFTFTMPEDFDLDDQRNTTGL